MLSTIVFPTDTLLVCNMWVIVCVLADFLAYSLESVWSSTSSESILSPRLYQAYNETT